MLSEPILAKTFTRAELTQLGKPLSGRGSNAIQWPRKLRLIADGPWAGRAEGIALIDIGLGEHRHV